MFSSYFMCRNGVSANFYCPHLQSKSRGFSNYIVRDTQPASRGICMGHIILPGHFCGLHCWVRSSGPLPEQSLPPNWGEGLVQFLCLFIVPPPQVTLQDDHLDHSVYPPLTILKYKPVISKDNVNLR